MLLFVLTATLDLDIDGKLVMLVLWIVAIIVADAYMIFIEYLRESLNSQARMTSLPDDELREELGRTYVRGVPARVVGTGLDHGIAGGAPAHITNGDAPKGGEE